MGDHAGDHDHHLGPEGLDGHTHEAQPDDVPARERGGPRLEDAVLDIGGDVGALILYASAAYDEREIEVSPVGDEARRTHTAIHQRRSAGDTVYAGIFPELHAGVYRIWSDRPGLIDRVTIVGGEVAEVDWR
ncbi:MAG: hypothetical protein ACHQZR_03030 [Candidatus Limnocylindrales bacterium]